MNSWQAIHWHNHYMTTRRHWWQGDQPQPTERGLVNQNWSAGVMTSGLLRGNLPRSFFFRWAIFWWYCHSPLNELFSMNVNNQCTHKHTHRTPHTLPLVYQYLVSADVISSNQKQHEVRFIVLLDRHQKCGTFGITINKQNDGNYNTSEPPTAHWSLYIPPV